MEQLITAAVVIAAFSALHERTLELIRFTVGRITDSLWEGEGEGWLTFLSDAFTRRGWSMALGALLALSTNANVFDLFRDCAAGTVPEGVEPAYEACFFSEYGWQTAAIEGTHWPSLPLGGIESGIARAIVGMWLAAALVLVLPAALDGMAAAVDRASESGKRGWFVGDHVAFRAVRNLAPPAILGTLMIWWLAGSPMVESDRVLGCIAMGAAASLGASFWHDLAFGLVDLRATVRELPNTAQADVAAAFERDA